MWMISQLTHLLFPTKCFGCGKHEATLCEKCIQLSRRSLSSLHPYVVSTFDFKDPLIKRVIHAIKYYHRRDLISPLIPAFATSVQELGLPEDCIVIPVPAPRLRKLLRGYNQAECIAIKLGTHLALPVRTALIVRNRSPKRQATLHSKKERVENQKGTFALLGNVTGLRILLVDDVTTTGATLDEVRKLLLAHGAASVQAATLAH